MAPSADSKISVENPGIDPGASRMRSGRSTNELIPQQDVMVTGLAPNNHIGVITPASPHTLPHKTGGSFFNPYFSLPDPRHPATIASFRRDSVRLNPALAPKDVRTIAKGVAHTLCGSTRKPFIHIQVF